MDIAKIYLGVCCVLLVACQQPTSSQNKEQDYLQEQEQQQGYRTLIATPVTANYALPFCEKQYCIDVEIFSFNSQDQWFNQYTNQQIADLIRQQLGLSQKLSLQRAVDEFVNLSDIWMAENPQQKAWSMYIKPRVAMQQGEIAVLEIRSEYHLGDRDIAEQQYFYVVDRKAQKTIKLYDLVKENQRVAFGQMLQQHYQQWQEKLSDQQKQNLSEKLYWANQDWFFDEQGIAIYYRAKDLGVEQAEDLTIYLTNEQMQKWINHEYLAQLYLHG